MNIDSLKYLYFGKLGKIGSAAKKNLGKPQLCSHNKDNIFKAKSLETRDSKHKSATQIKVDKIQSKKHSGEKDDGKINSAHLIQKEKIPLRYENKDSGDDENVNKETTQSTLNVPCVPHISSGKGLFPLREHERKKQEMGGTVALH